MLSLMQHVMLVNEHGSTIGTLEKKTAHAGKGQLHRAFSIFVFRNGGKELLLQKRVEEKLFGNLWTNTCCSHPHPGETIIDAAKRRLKEELGFTCDLEESQSFIYHAEDPEGKGVEHEYDTVLTGTFPDNATVNQNPQEVTEWKWMNVEELQQDVRKNTMVYTPWFPQALAIALTRNLLH